MGKKSETVLIKSHDAEMRRYRAEDAHRDFARVEEHKKDPSLMKEVAKVNAQKQKELASVKVTLGNDTK